MYGQPTVNANQAIGGQIKTPTKKKPGYSLNPQAAGPASSSSLMGPMQAAQIQQPTMDQSKMGNVPMYAQQPGAIAQPMVQPGMPVPGVGQPDPRLAQMRARLSSMSGPYGGVLRRY